MKQLEQMAPVTATELGHFIDGKKTFGHSARRAPVFDPSTGMQSATLRLADASDVETAVASAQAGGGEPA